MGLLFLSGCGRKKQQVKKVQHDPVSMPVASDKNPKLGFFDENVGAFDDLESFVLDDEAMQQNQYPLVTQTDKQSFDVAATDRTVPETEVVYFDYDSDQIRADQKNALAQIQKTVSQWIKDGQTVVFKGHSCKWHGTRAYNVALSSARAEKMAQLCNISKDRMKVFGVGNEEPIVFENSKDGQAPNRRVEIYAVST